MSLAFVVYDSTWRSGAWAIRFFGSAACVALFALGCGPSGYYYDASEGRVACEVDDMYIKDPESFGTRKWVVKCVEGLHKNKVFDCEGTKTNAKCIERNK